MKQGWNLTAQLVENPSSREVSLMFFKLHICICTYTDTHIQSWRGIFVSVLNKATLQRSISNYCFKSVNKEGLLNKKKSKQKSVGYKLLPTVVLFLPCYLKSFQGAEKLGTL